jgi:hypothetical protein
VNALEVAGSWQTPREPVKSIKGASFHLVPVGHNRVVLIDPARVTAFVYVAVVSGILARLKSTRSFELQYVVTGRINSLSGHVSIIDESHLFGFAHLTPAQVCRL